MKYGTLVVSRRFGESIMINGNIMVKVKSFGDSQVKLVINAPVDVVVDRLEIHNKKNENNEI